MFRRFRNYPQIGGKRGGIPADCVEVQYLESTGTQYIDTGVYFCISDSRSPKIGFDYAMTQKDSSTPRLLGYINSPALMQVYYDSGSDTIRWQPLPNTTTIYSTGYAWDANRHSTVVDFTTSAITISEDGKTLETGICRRIPLSSRPMYLFARNNNGSAANFASYQLYGFSYDDGVQKLNLVPVRRTTDGLGYMCDTLTGKLYGNAGTGAFVIGPDKGLPYDERIDYVMANGGQYAVLKSVQGLDAATNDVDIEVVASSETAGGSIFLANLVQNATNRISIEVIRHSVYKFLPTLRYFSVQYYKVQTFDMTSPRKFRVNREGAWIDDSKVQSFSVSPTGTWIRNINLLRSAYNNTISAGVTRIYSVKISQNGVPIYDLVPCVKDGVVCFYNAVDKSFVYSDGTAFLRPNT